MRARDLAFLVVPVNYAIPFSGLVTPAAVLGINARTPPPLFPPAPSFLSPFLSSSASLTSASFTSAPTLLKSNSYDRAEEKNGSAGPPAYVRFMPRNTLRYSHLLLIRLPLDPTFLSGGLALTVTSMACLVFPVAGCPLMRWP